MNRISVTLISIFRMWAREQRKRLIDAMQKPCNKTISYPAWKIKGAKLDLGTLTEYKCSQRVAAA